MESLTVSPEDWVVALGKFTDRNAGRRTWLEVDDPEFGAQMQQHEYQLMGVSYDARDERIQIMLGTFSGVGPHLTHTIGRIEQIDILTDDRGHDSTLRIAQADRQTLLRVEPPGSFTP